MSDPNEPIEYVRAAVDDLLAIGFTATCELRSGKIVVTLCRGTHTATFELPADLQDIDSDGVTDALRMPMEKARRFLLALDAPKRKAKKRKKAKRAKRNQIHQRAAPDLKGREGTEGANGSPTSTESTRETTDD